MSDSMLPASALARLFAGLTLRRILIAVVLAVSVALFLDTFFTPTLLEMIGRTVTVALLALLAFTVAGNWRQSIMPTWVLQLLAMGLAIPLATLAIYLVKTGGDVDRLLSQWGFMSGMAWIAGSGLFVALLVALGALFRERDAQAHAMTLQWELERSTLQRQALDAQLRSLQAQIEPHFLFNTLANVQALVETGSPRATQVLTSLIAYLKTAMQHARRESCTLAEEFELAHAYLDVMQLRMPDRLRFHLDLPDDLRATAFAPLAVLTLVENAVRHGVDPSEDGGSIALSARRDGGQIRISVVNTGRGLDREAVPGTGLANVRERLKARFGSTARLELSEQPGQGVTAALVFDAAPSAG
jgi:signal transduction histidine kinase